MAACKLLANLHDLTEASSLLSPPGVLCEVSGDTNSERSKRCAWQQAIVKCMISDLILQLEDKRVLMLRVFTAVYGSSAPASGLKQVTLSDLCACRTCRVFNVMFQKTER